MRCSPHTDPAACLTSLSLPSQVVKVFLEERLRIDDAFTDATETDLGHLRTIFGLGPKEVSQIRDDIVVRIYR